MEEKEKTLIYCKKCEKEILGFSGKYTDMLDCGHIMSKSLTSDVLSKSNQGSGPKISVVEAERISQKLEKVSELPKINGNDLISRALSATSQDYDSFFSSENLIIEDMIKEHGKDSAVLVFTAIHSHLTKTLFKLNRFKNVYRVKIEQLRKEIEDKAVKELISSHDFSYEGLNSITGVKPKKIQTIGNKLDKKYKTGMDEAKSSLGSLTKSDGSKLDTSTLLLELMTFKKKPLSEQKDYKEGLDKIKESILSNSKKE